MKGLIALSVLVTLGMSGAQAAERTVKFSVDNMYCEMCPLTVGKAMQAVKGVKSAKADLTTKSAVVVFDDSVATVDAIAAASANAGYPAQLAAN